MQILVIFDLFYPRNSPFIIYHWLVCAGSHALRFANLWLRFLINSTFSKSQYMWGSVRYWCFLHLFVCESVYVTCLCTWLSICLRVLFVCLLFFLPVCVRYSTVCLCVYYRVLTGISPTICLPVEIKWKKMPKVLPCLLHHRVYKKQHTIFGVCRFLESATTL